MYNLKRNTFIFFIFFSLTLSAQYDAERYPIIPKPYALLPFDGEFSLNAETVLITDNKFYRNEITFFRKQVKQFYGIDLKFASKKVGSNFIYISEDSTDIPNEGYNLFINRNEINIYGGHAGIFYALQSLFQLIHTAKQNDKDSNLVKNIPAPVHSPNSTLQTPNFLIPSCSIVDQPRFAWRGMHLDVSRHFFPKEDVKNYLRYMAMYKFNTFHWHLTDDQGWRIEIKKYPKLTSVGAWRTGTLIGHEGETNPRYDSIYYGGFYTQDDIREIVKFADSLHITIVPEIEMPGHSMAMLAAYPELGCTAGPFSVAKTWGVFDDVLCPSEKTFSFLDDVLKEVCALFPGKYIHIGGDECPKARWKASAFCQDLMKTNNLKTEDELQSWFTQRIVKLLQTKGKQAIGWDEILEGGLADGAAVMSWRGEEGGIAAAKAKHNVVMSPGTYCYFDHYQSQSSTEPLAIGGFLPIEKVYSYDPVPSSLSADEKKYIMGVQANVWTEYIPDFKQVQYMIFPRMCAMAEVCWDETINKNFDFFMQRLIFHLHFLDAAKINYAKSVFDIRYSISPNGADGLLLTLSTYKKGAVIKYCHSAYERYTNTYSSPIKISSSSTIYAQAFYNDQPISQQIVLPFTVNKATGKPIVLRKPPSPSYNNGGPTTLVDGKYGRIPWVGSEWLGWSGDTLDATIDLMEKTSISEIRISTLFDPSSWIYQPGNFVLYTSDDGKNFSPAKQLIETDNSGNESRHEFKLENVNARYVRIVVSGMAKIPTGSPGEGNPPWLFVDEIWIN
jgi:hexosaminidase